MDNSTKRNFDKLSVTKDIAERQNIIHKFETTGFLDRNEAINKVTSLQITDAELLTATKLKQAASGSVNLYQADDNTIISNLQFQVDFLISKLGKLNLEDKNGNNKTFCKMGWWNRKFNITINNHL